VKGSPRAEAAPCAGPWQPSPELDGRLDALLRETYALWDAGWVNFNWRGYTYDHVQRVRRLALTLAGRVGADPTVVHLAALLHDVTKPYDGEYVLDADGRRVVDADGLWRCETRPPTRRNAVTELYDRLGLAGTLHNESGAVIARHLLEGMGVDGSIAERVAQTITHHLRPPDDAPVESRCLYDADTIDANIGLPAFVRNVYIHLHYRDVRLAPGDVPTDEILRDSPLDYLGPYIRERLPAWSLGKRNDFVPRLLCPTSVDLADARLRRLDWVWARLARELDAPDGMGERGCLAAVLYIMRHREDPSIDAVAAYLRDVWVRRADPTPAAVAFVEMLDREVRGVE